MGDEERDTRDKPAVPVPGGDENELIRACEEDRGSLTPKETADCAGATLVERYEIDEDGGS